MLSSWRRLALGLTVPVVFATACGAEDQSIDSTSDEINYRSTSGQEYLLSTTVSFALTEEMRALQGEEREKAIAAHADQLRTRVTATISSELDKIWPEEARIARGGGVAIQLRQGSAVYRDLKLEADGRYSILVSGEFAGVKDIEKKLPMKTVEGRTFLPVSADQGTGPVELEVTLAPIERSLNAYPKYLQLFEDGLDISVHVGGDHNEPAQDINHARSIYDDLLASGFKSPVPTFAELKADSAPLTSSIKVKGQAVPVRVRIFHVDMTTPETREVLVQAYKDAMKTADVVIYDGHAGRRLDYSGVVLAYKPARVSVTAADFAKIEASTKQQVYLFNGCETYTGYSDKLYENPNKNADNTDVITTANYSAIQYKANQVISFIHSFVDQRAGTWIPRSWDSVLTQMNAAGERSWVHVYGVHGLDDNPKASPLADASRVGATCATDADCGAADSRCIPVSGSRKVCGIACADTAGCPSGTKCVLPRGRTGLDDMQCATN
jgi:hypothetical protein